MKSRVIFYLGSGFGSGFTNFKSLLVEIVQIPREGSSSLTAAAKTCVRTNSKKKAARYSKLKTLF
jgi:hypothetical protein